MSPSTLKARHVVFLIERELCSNAEQEIIEPSAAHIGVFGTYCNLNLIFTRLVYHHRQPANWPPGND